MDKQPTYRVCPHCKVRKLSGEFCLNNSRSSNLHVYCRGCDSEKRKGYPFNSYPKHRGEVKIKFRGIKANSRIRRIEFNLGIDEFTDWYNNQEKKCHYCNRELVQFKKGDNGMTIDRLDNTIGYEIKNIVLCCWRCNIIKGHWFTEQDMLEIAGGYLREGG